MTKKPRLCKACNQEIPLDGPDPCIGYLPGVNFACCGHGGMEKGSMGYISFENGIVIRFEKLLEVQKWEGEEKIEIIYQDYSGKND